MNLFLLSVDRLHDEASQDRDGRTTRESRCSRGHCCAIVTTIRRKDSTAATSLQEIREFLLSSLRA